MAALTWHNVAAPNFSPATDALRTAAGLFDGAFSGLAEGFKDFEGKRDTRLNNAFQLELLKYQDPEAYKAALQSGEIYGNIDKGRLNADSIAAASARTGELLGEQHKGLLIDQGQFNLDEDRGAAERSAAFAPILAKAASMGDEEAAVSFVTEQAGKLNMRADEVEGAIGSLFGYADSRSGLANDRQDRRISENNENRAQELHDQGRWRFSVEQLTYSEERQAAEAAEQVSRLPPEERLRAINTSGLTGPVAARVRQLTGVGIDGSLGGTPAVTTGGSGSPEVLGLTYGGGQLPASVRTVGDAIRYGPQLVNSLGASPMGIYQINYGTLKDFAPKALGEGWESADFRSFEVQDKVGRKIWESIDGVGTRLWDKGANGGKGNGRWAALGKFSQAEINRIAKLPWEEAREIIAQGESRSSPAALIAAMSPSNQRIAEAGQEVKERVEAGKLDNPVLAGWARFQDKGDLPLSGVLESRTVRDWAKKEGLSLREVERSINWVMGLAEKAGVPMNYAQAATIIKRTGAVRDRTVWDTFTPLELRGSMTINGDKMLDESRIREALGTIGPNAEGVVDQAVGQQSVEERATMRREARERAEKLDAEIQRAITRGDDVNFPGRFRDLIERRNVATATANGRAIDPYVTESEREAAAADAPKPRETREERAAQLRQATTAAVAEGRRREAERRRLRQRELDRLREDNGVRSAFGPNFQPAVR